MIQQVHDKEEKKRITRQVLEALWNPCQIYVMALK